MSFVETNRELLDRLAEAAFAELRPGEELNLCLSAEDQTYVRFNNAKVRQTTGVTQRRLSLTFQSQRRKLSMTLDLSGQAECDLATLRALLEHARAQIRSVPEDPFLVHLENGGASDQRYAGSYPAIDEWMAQITETAAGLDFTGLLAAGPQIRAACNSAGQNHWFSTDSFFLDYSLFTVNAAGETKAIKGLYADRHWRLDHFARAVEAGKRELALLKRPARILPPGEYRVYLAPAAVEKIVHMFSWGAVSYEAWKKGHSALRKLVEGQVELSGQFTLKENFRLGLSPRFNSLGELTPVELPIIENGKLQNLLVSSRSAKEYGVAANGADSLGWQGEGMRSPEVAGGDLAEADALKRLHNGLYIGNLHYLNWSDLQSARITGMTRYACFRVANGEIAEPIGDLRFDESLYRIFGATLEALTRQSQLFPSTDTYFRRALGGSLVPGAIAGAFRFTL